MEKLAAPSGAFLVNNDRVQSTDRLYLKVPRIAKPQFSKALLDITSMTPVEEQLLEALKEAQENETYQHGVIVGMQSMFVLQNVYCEKVRGQVAAKEAKEDEGKEKRGRLVGDGLPLVLTSDTFVEAVVNYNRAQRDLERQKVQRRLTKAEQKIVMDEWHLLEVTQKALNEKCCIEFTAATAKWEAARDKARKAKKPYKVPRPKHGELAKPIPEPKQFQGPETTLETLEEVDEDGKFIEINEEGSDDSDGEDSRSE